MHTHMLLINPPPPPPRRRIVHQEGEAGMTWYVEALLSFDPRGLAHLGL